MPCYWACGTTANKITWGVIIFLGIAGAAIAIAGGAGGASGNPSCFSQTKNCTDSGQSRDTCGNLFPCSRTYANLIVAGVIIFLAGVFGPMSFFCCCSNSPDTAANGAVAQVGYYNPNPASAAPPAAIPVATYTPLAPYVPPPPVAADNKDNAPVVGVPYNPVVAQPWTPNP